jgi:hypothetical protein
VTAVARRALRVADEPEAATRGGSALRPGQWLLVRGSTLGDGEPAVVSVDPVRPAMPSTSHCSRRSAG